MSDPKKPILFQLHKIGPVEPLFHRDKRWNLPLDGTLREIVLDSENGLGDHKIQFRLTSDWRFLPDENESVGKRYAWKLEMKVPGGGFCKWEKELETIAPLDGYQEAWVFDHPKEPPVGKKWEHEEYARLFVKFPDQTYARIRVTLESFTDDTPLIMECWTNLKPGSRNLNSATHDGSRVYDQ